jgi:hypothetical protein
MMVTGNNTKRTELIIGSRKTSGQKSAWEDLNFLLPRSFIAELIRYKRDNSIAVTYGMQGPQMHCCERCLKAHAIATAIQMGFDTVSLSHVKKMIPGDAGHDGYYLDKDKVISINTIIE